VNTDSNESVPTVIGGRKVVVYSRIDERHEATGAGWQSLHGVRVRGPAWGVAICESPADGGFLLFSCENDWMPVEDTWHPTLEDAKGQAEFEYEGLESTWQVPPS
jgi:hypothetical protein